MRLCGQGTELPSVICSGAERRAPRASAVAARNVYRSIPVVLLNFNGLRWSGAQAGELLDLEPGVPYRCQRFHRYLNRVQIAIVSGFLSVIYGALEVYAVHADNRPPHGRAIFPMVL